MQWAFSLCAAMAAIGLCRMLVPASGMEKTFRFVVSIFFLASLLTPVAVRFPSLMVDIPFATQEEIDARALRLEELSHRQALHAADTALARLVEDKLSEMGINVYGVAINFTTSQAGEVLLESIEVTLSAGYADREIELAGYLESEVGGEVIFRYIGREGE